MAANLFNSRFIQAGRTPAWHLEGWLLGDEEIDAETAYRRTGTYEVNKVNLRAVMAPVSPDDETIPVKNTLPVDYSIIVREPTKEDPHQRVFGSPVSKDYELIGPLESAQIWDRAVGNNGVTHTPIETFGVLGKGEELFITALTYNFGVKGDEVNTYEFLYSPMYSDKAAVAGMTGVRVVCANTLAIALKGSMNKFYIDHRPGCAMKIESAIRDIHNKHRDNVLIMEQAFNAMADIRVEKAAEAQMLLSQIYPDPPKPEESWDMQFGITYEAHLQKFEEKMAAIKEVRATVLNLFAGDGTGMDMVSVMGTRYGLYNSVAEFETYRRGPHDRAAVSLTVGDRASVIRKAYEVLARK